MIVPHAAVVVDEGQPVVTVLVGEETLSKMSGLTMDQAGEVAATINEAVDAMLRVNALRAVFRSCPTEMLDHCEGGPLEQPQLRPPGAAPL